MTAMASHDHVLVLELGMGTHDGVVGQSVGLYVTRQILDASEFEHLVVARVRVELVEGHGHRPVCLLTEQTGWPCGACGHGRHAIPDHVVLLRTALDPRSPHA